MRELTGHKVNGCNDRLHIHAVDKPGPGGANHVYSIGGFIRRNAAGTDDETCTTITFQNGPIAEVGTNGVTHEALIAIVIDRLESFQAGPFKCEENATALSCLQMAQAALKSRTEKRLARGVEGTHQI